MTEDANYLEVNRANWDARAPLHAAARSLTEPAPPPDVEDVLEGMIVARFYTED